MLKIKPRFDFNKYDLSIGFMIHKENESKKYIRDKIIINYVFGIVILWFSMGIIIEFSRKSKGVNNMSEEEFFNRMINQISKVFDGRIATKMKNIYLKKDKQLNKQKEVLDKIKEYCNHKLEMLELQKRNIMQILTPENGYLKANIEIEMQKYKDILELLEEIE